MSFWSTLTGTTPQEEQEAQLAAGKERYRGALQRRIDDGSISPQQVAADQTYVNDLALEDTDAAAAAGFREGLQEGLGNITSKATDFLKLIPWQVWIAGGVGLFLYFGGFVLLKKLITRK